MPMLLFAVFIIITIIPHGFSIMSEEIHPWYAPYTSFIYPFLAMFFYPVTLLIMVFGWKVLGFGYMAVALVYSMGISYAINLLWKHKKEPNSKT